ncbi:alpha-aminoadipic semialdehyde synthase, partial [Phenoliferia sp. Uapishka_3]
MRLQPTLSSPSLRRISSHARPNVLGLRAEDALRRWERRVPLTPTAVGAFVREGVKVLVQPSDKRIFSDEAYDKAGATITSSLSPASLVLGIKEIPAETLEPGTTYASFSHTHKGQEYNLPLLQRQLDTPSSRFIDWELLTDDNSVRTTAFGFLAGFSGMSDGLSLFGTKALASQGCATPFLTLPRPFMIPDVDRLKAELRRVGGEISKNGTPKIMGPIVVAVTGSGRVGKGARAVLDELPTTWIKASELQSIVESSDTDLRRIYACQLELGDYLTRTDGIPFDRESYRTNPDLYYSQFDSKIAPFTTILLNGAFWQPGYPRILSTAQLADIQASISPSRFLSVVDVSCDFGGGLEFVTSPTTIDDPVFQFEASTGEQHRNPGQPHSTQISSIEILPSQLPLDSSTHFSEAITPYVTSLLRDPKSEATNEYSRALKRATIVRDGKLTSNHVGLYELLKANKEKLGKTEKRKRVLLLGSGLVAGPAVRVLTSRRDVDLVIASNSLPSAQALASSHPNATAVLLDAGDEGQLEALIKSSDVALRYSLPLFCTLNKTSLVTASYVSPAMEALHEKAKAAGVVLLNELGLDPGIDHCSAMRLIQEARDSGNKQITSFVSFCGGLPPPSQSNGPLGYKFSWSPRGVLTAALNPASFRLSSNHHSISSSNLLSSYFPTVPIIRGFALEGLANRDSLPYLKEYGLPEDIGTILRGTLRYPGFSKVVDGMRRIGLLEMEAGKALAATGWEDVVDACLRLKGLEGGDGRKESIKSFLEDNSDREELLQDLLETLSALSLIPSSTPSLFPLPEFPAIPRPPLDLLSSLLASQLKYGPDEADAVILHHELGTVNVHGEDELFTSTLVQYGTPGSDSAMATTVGIVRPCALRIHLDLADVSFLFLIKANRSWCTVDFIRRSVFDAWPCLAVKRSGLETTPRQLRAAWGQASRAKEERKRSPSGVGEGDGE